jgi:hypothetical protein
MARSRHEPGQAHRLARIHAGTSVAAGDRAGLERLLRYMGRGPLSVQRLSRTETGKVRYRLRKPYFTGQTEVVLEPVALLKRLATPDFALHSSYLPRARRGSTSARFRHSRVCPLAARDRYTRTS